MVLKREIMISVVIVNLTVDGVASATVGAGLVGIDAATLRGSVSLSFRLPECLVTIGASISDTPG